MAKKLTWVAWLGNFLIAIALFNWGLLWWFGFNLITALSFGVRFIEGALYTIVAVLGGYALGEMIYKLFK